MSYSAYPRSRGSQSYSPSSRSRGRFGARPSQRSFGAGGRSQGPRPQYIHPSRYVNKAAVQAPVEEIPVTHVFTDFALDQRLQRNIERHGYTQPTPIQDQTIPLALEGRDIVGIANTGTGKTAAFLLPILQKIIVDHEQGALIMVPTRELATQVEEECRALAQGLPIGIVLCVGGLSIIPQVENLKRNPHIVIGTPGRLKDLVQRDSLHLELFTTIVLDEVDRMLDIGFRKDILELVGRFPKTRHSLCFSATMTSEVESIMNSFLQNPAKVSVKVTETNEHIEQDIIRVPVGSNKIDVLVQLLSQEEFGKVIVFGRTKHGINKLEQILSQQGLYVTSIHGNKTQAARQHALTDFKRGRVQALLATDVAARGIDIDGVTHVINFDEPNTYEDYVHRIGRTGRAGKAGKALTFVN